MTAAPPAGLRLIGLTRHRAPVLEQFDLDVAGGELLALLAPDGCGGTVLRLVAGVDRPDAGRVLLGGMDITDLPAGGRDVGAVLPADRLVRHRTVGDNVAAGSAPGTSVRRRRAERRRRAVDVLALVGLGDRADHHPRRLTTEDRLRVLLARALAAGPRVLLLDDPFAALSGPPRARLREELRRLQLSLGITSLVTTPEPAEALAIADRVAVLRAGRLEQVGRPEELYDRPVTGFVASLVGVMNRLPAVLGDGDVEFLGVRREVLGAAPPPGPALALVRPEALEVAADPHGAGRVISRAFAGATTHLAVALPDGIEVQVDLPGREGRDLLPGTPVTVLPAEQPVLVAPLGSSR